MKATIKHLLIALFLTGFAILGSQTAKAQCQASFTYVDNGGGNFLFTNTSTGNFLFYYWTFGDGNNDWSQNTSNSYINNGAYEVCLTIFDSISQCQSTFCDSILVTGAVSCNLNAAFTSTYNGNNNYSFTSNATGNFNYEYWDFGDGNFDFGPTTSHTYASNGTYLVTLIVGDSNTTCADTSFQYVYPNNANCNVTASFNAVDNGNGNFSFNNTSVGTGLTYYWNFGDGNTSNATNPNHTYSANGTYAVQLIAFDPTDSNCVDFAHQTITVTGVSNPVACQAGFIVYPDSSNPGNVIVVNNSTGNNLFYYWSFGDGNFSNQQFPSYTYSTSGPFELCLTVFDSISQCQSTYCDSIFSGGLVIKQTGFTINVISPNATGVEEEIEIINDFSAYPNPVKNTLTIDVNLNDQAMVDVSIIDLLGNQVALISQGLLKAGSNILQWNSNNVANGVYLLNIKTDKSLKVKKLVVNK